MCSDWYSTTAAGMAISGVFWEIDFIRPKPNASGTHLLTTFLLFCANRSTHYRKKHVLVNSLSTQWRIRGPTGCRGRLSAPSSSSSKCVLLRHIIICIVSQNYNSAIAEVNIESCNSNNYTIIGSDLDRSKQWILTTSELN